MRISIILLTFLVVFISVQGALAQIEKSNRPTSPSETQQVTIDTTEAVRPALKKFGFIFNGGFNLTTWIELYSEGNAEPLKADRGYEGGIGIVYRFKNPNLRMRFETLYSYRQYRTYTNRREEREHTVTHLVVPTLFEYQRNRFSLITGPQINYLLKDQVNILSIDWTDLRDRFFPSIRIGVGYNLTTTLGETIKIEASEVFDFGNDLIFSFSLKLLYVI